MTNETSFTAGSNWPKIAFLFLVTACAVALFPAHGNSDVEIWNNWMTEISRNGLVGGYMNSDTDYPPLTFVILAGIVKSATALGVAPFVVLKSSLLFFLLATAACFYAFTRDLVLTAALELALTLSSMGLAYLDIYFAPFLVAAFFLFQRRQFSLGLLCYAISLATKWQPLIIAPFVCLYLLSNAGDSSSTSKLRAKITPFVLGAIAIGLLLLIFDGKVFDALKRAMTYHKFLSAYALNLPWIETWALHLLDPQKYGALQDGLIDIFIVRDPLIVWPNKILFYVSYAATLFIFWRQPKTFQRLLVYSILGYLAYFLFNTSVHENHLFLVCCLVWALVFVERGQLVRAINLTIAANANLFLFYGAFGQRLNPVLAGIDITLIFAAANLCLFGGFALHAFKSDRASFGFSQPEPR